MFSCFGQLLGIWSHWAPGPKCLLAPAVCKRLHVVSTVIPVPRCACFHVSRCSFPCVCVCVSVLVLKRAVVDCSLAGAKVCWRREAFVRPVIVQWQRVVASVVTPCRIPSILLVPTLSLLLLSPGVLPIKWWFANEMDAKQLLVWGWVAWYCVPSIDRILAT